jgi:hypothetical protein
MKITEFRIYCCRRPKPLLCKLAPQPKNECQKRKSTAVIWSQLSVAVTVASCQNGLLVFRQ